MSIAFGTTTDGRFVARIDGEVYDVPNHESLDALLHEARSGWLAVIDSLLALHGDGDLERVENVELGLPFTPGDYVDFSSSIEHATFWGRKVRSEGDPLGANWRSLPIGYHGRSATIVPSGTKIRRPLGQTPDWGPTKTLDIEVELGYVLGGPPNALGEPIPIGEVEERIFGIVLLNDWSARDIQVFEMPPLGPFLSKAFATSISSWVVPIAALEHSRVAGPKQEPEPLPYLSGGGDWNFDIEFVVELNGQRIASTNSRVMYWSAAQQLAHLASGGAVVRPGDVFATGTISGGTEETGGCLPEMGRPFLEDGDEVVIRATAGDVYVGEVAGTIEPSAAG